MSECRIAAAALGILCVILIVWILELKRAAKRLRSENEQLAKQNEHLSKQLEEALKQLAARDKEPKSKHLNKLVNVLSAAGPSSLIFLGAVAVSGFYGAAAITSALATLGGPWGMVGGVGVLMLLTAVLSQYSILEVSRLVIAKLLQTKSKPQMIRYIDSLPRIIPEKFRVKAKALLEDAI